jgi:hypothetical protein
MYASYNHNQVSLSLLRDNPWQQQIVVLYGELLSQPHEAGLTRTYRDVLRFCKLENINCLVLRHLNTGQSPFEEWAKEWLHEGEV